MNINSKHVAALLAASAMAFGIAAEAQQPQPQQGCPMMGQGMGGGQRMHNPGAFAEQHLAQFKSQLKITPQQEPLWQAFAEKVKASAGQMKPPMQDPAAQQKTAPERMSLMIEHMKAHTAAMESVNDSFKRLYDALTPEQKATADKFQPFGGGMGQKGGMRGGGMMGPGGGQGPGAGRGMAPQ